MKCVLEVFFFLENQQIELKEIFVIWNLVKHWYMISEVELYILVSHYDYQEFIICSVL